VIRTDRLLLRPLTEADVDDLVALDADPEVRRFLARDATSRAAIECELLPRILEQYERHPGFGRWAAIELATGEFVGWFELEASDGEPGAAELGYRLRRSAWGKGYATEGACALVDWAFAELGVDRVYAETMAVNAASRRVLEKAGLRNVRTFHLEWDDPLEGTEEGEVEYELRRGDWERAGAR
jgi:RimJ/RimL family protein N-acetyltransferase